MAGEQKGDFHVFAEAELCKQPAGSGMVIAGGSSGTRGTALDCRQDTIHSFNALCAFIKRLTIPKNTSRERPAYVAAVGYLFNSGGLVHGLRRLRPNAEQYPAECAGAAEPVRKPGDHRQHAAAYLV